MSDRDQFNKSFRDERHGFGAGIPTSLGGALGKMSAQQQKDVAEGRVQHGASGALILEMMRGGLISRGILVAVIGIIVGIAGANAPPGSWGIVAGMLGSSILLAIGGGMIAVGVLGPVDLSGKAKEGGMKDPVILGSLQHQN